MKYTNPFSISSILKEYHKKHFRKAVIFAIILVSAGSLITGLSLHESGNSLNWYAYLFYCLIIALACYLVFLLIFIPFYLANIYPYKYLMILYSPKTYKVIFLVLLLLFGLPFILGENDLKLTDMADIVSLCWGIFGISVTFALVTYYLVVENLSKEKSGITKFGKLDHNVNVFLSLSTFFMLSLNVFFLSWSTSSVYLSPKSEERFAQILIQLTVFLSLNVVASATYDFIAFLKNKKREIEFESAEVVLEKKEMEDQSRKFSELRKLIKEMSIRFKSQKEIQKDLVKIVDFNTEALSAFEEFNKKSESGKINPRDSKKMLVIANKYIANNKKIDSMLSTLKEIDARLAEIRKKMETIPNELG